MATLVERLGDIAHLDDHPTAEQVLRLVGLRYRDLVQAVDVVATRHVAGVAHLDERRHDRPASLVGERAAIDEHAGRQRRADLRERARDRVQHTLRLAHAVARQALQQPDRVGVLGLLEDLDGVTLLDELAGVHDADAIAHRADHAQVVGDQQDRRVRLVAQRSHEVEHLCLDSRIETRCRLVEHEQLRVAGECHGDDDALLHAPRQLVRVALHDALRIGDAHTAQCAERLLPSVSPVDTEDREGLGDLTADLQRRIQGRARVLVHHRRLGRPEPPEVAL